MTANAAIVAVGAFLAPLMPAGTKIVRGQTNGVPLPLPPCVVLTEIGQNQFTTTRTKLDAFVGNMTYLMPKVLNVQIDFYGATASDMSNTAVTMLRSIYGTANFPDGVTPLYCSDAMQSHLITGEKQYENRWVTTLSLQYNAPVVVGQESFAIVGDVLIDPVDITIPVE